MDTNLKISLGDAKDAALAALLKATNDLITGSAADVKNYLNAILSDAMEAGLANDQDVLAQLADQRSVIMEINRVRWVEGAAEFGQKLITLGVDVLLRLLVPIPLPGAGAVVAGIVNDVVNDVVTGGGGDSTPAPATEPAPVLPVTEPEPAAEAPPSEAGDPPATGLGTDGQL